MIHKFFENGEVATAHCTYKNRLETLQKANKHDRSNATTIQNTKN